MKRQERKGVYPAHYDMLPMVPILFLSKIFPNLEGRFDLLFIFKVTFWFLIKTHKLTRVPSDFYKLWHGERNGEKGGKKMKRPSA